MITTNTASHAELIHRALDARTPVFSEKPVALDIPGTLAVVEHAERVPEIPVQLGFQRRFDAGYRAAGEAYRSGELGFVHTLHATTLDEEPPPAAYIPTSGGIFKDVSIHDFDIIGWVTGCTPVSVYATGSNMGEDFFTAADDVDTGHCLVTYDDGMVAHVSASRNSGAGHDVRLELFGSRSGRFVGLDERTPLISADTGKPLWSHDPYHTYHERFSAAFVAELSHFVSVAAGEASSACTPKEALAALQLAEAATVSRREDRIVRLPTA